MAGTLKALYSTWRTRKHAAEVEKNEPEQRLQSQPHSNPYSGHPVAMVPFGIKALKSGLEVEGVWISHPSSAQSSDEESYNSSPEDTRQSGWNAIATTPQRQFSKRNHPSPSPLRRTFEPEADVHTRGRPIGRVCSTSKHLSYRTEGAEQKRELEELDAVYRTPRWFREESVSISTAEDEACDDGGSSVTGRASPTFRQQQEPSKEESRARQRSADFTLLEHHRQSQAAETGQLTSRALKGLRSETKVSTPVSTPVKLRPQSLSRLPHPKATNLPEPSPGDWEELLNRSRSPRARPPTYPVQPLPPMPTTMTPSDEQPKSRDKINPRDSNTISRDNTTNPRDSTTHPRNSTISSRDSKINRRDSKTDPPTPTTASSNASTTLNTDVGLYELEDTSPKRQSFEKSTSLQDKVVRGYGSGFEILKPGTLDTSSSQARNNRRQQSAPPVSLDSYTHPRRESTSRGRGRRLQKKRSPSVDSQASMRSTSTSRSRFSIVSLWSRRDSLS